MKQYALCSLLVVLGAGPSGSACGTRTSSGPSSAQPASSNASTVSRGTAADASAASPPLRPEELAIVKQYCTGLGGNVTAYEDDSGTVGGYTVTGGVMDGPVTYLDARGEVLGSFHIFSNPQTTEKKPGAIAKLQKDFPKARRIGC